MRSLPQPRAASPAVATFRGALPALLALLLLLAACAAPGGPQASLYQRLGGHAGVQAVVERTIDRAAGDPRTRRSFEDVKLQALKDSLAQQLCALTDGGCRYEGETMARSHADLHILPSEFDAMVGILREELDREGIEPSAKNQLLRLLAPMKREIIGSPPVAAR